MKEKIMEEMPDDPIALFKTWLDLAKENEVNDAEAMALATCSRSGKPSVRMVLLKDVSEKGFKFHTNAQSHKGSDLAENPYCALCFYWKSLRRQVRVEGRIEIVSNAEADAYFADRPYARQIGAWASQQSRPLETRYFLENKIKEFEQKYPQGQPVPRPDYWVGYRVIPENIEFWWDNPDRLHDRFIYEMNTDRTWSITRLYP